MHENLKPDTSAPAQFCRFRHLEVNSACAGSLNSEKR